MSNDSQDFVFDVDWGDVPAPELSPPAVKSSPTPLQTAPEQRAAVAPPGNQPPFSTASPTASRPSPSVVAPAPPVSSVSGPSSAPTPASIPARTLIRGQRVLLSELGINEDEFRIGVQISHGSRETLDVTCLGLDAQSRLSDERYFIFYNQPSSPCGGLLLLGSGGAFQQVIGVRLSRLPSTIERLAIVAAFESGGTMAGLCASRLALVNGDSPGSLDERQLPGDKAGRLASHDEEHSVAEFAFVGSDFGSERALVIAEIYRRDGKWRFAAAGQGFGGGLAALLRHYGAEVSD